MESKILSQLGVIALDPFWFLLTSIVAVAVMIALIAVWVRQTRRVRELSARLDRLCTGKQGDSLEEELDKILADNEYLLKNVEEHKKNIRSLNKRMEKTYQKMKLVRYDAYREMGGLMSFVLVVLDEFDNGFLLNSVHNSSGCFCYAKEIVGGESTTNLGEEEAKALAEAKAIPVQH